MGPTVRETYCDGANGISDVPVLQHGRGVGCLGKPRTVVIDVPQLDVNPR